MAGQCKSTAQGRNLLYTGVTRGRDRHDDHPRQRNRAPALASYLSASAVSMWGRLLECEEVAKRKNIGTKFQSLTLILAEIMSSALWIEIYDPSPSFRNSLRCTHSVSSIFSLLSHVARGRLRRCADFQRSLDRLSRLRAFQTDILIWAVMQSFSPKSATECPPCPKCGA